MSRRSDRNDESGFTLVELLAVIVIIGILAAIALPTLITQTRKADRATLLSDLRNLSAAQEAYFVDRGDYTTDEEVLKAEGLNRSSRVSALEIEVYSADGAPAYCARATHSSSGGVAWISSASGAVTEVIPDADNCPG